MTQENKDRLLRLLQQHKELGISEQIDFDKFYLEGGRGKTEDGRRNEITRTVPAVPCC